MVNMLIREKILQEKTNVREKSPVPSLHNFNVRKNFFKKKQTEKVSYSQS
jgi:hypothetical protein